jgi:hypothetical protein
MKINRLLVRATLAAAFSLTVFAAERTPSLTKPAAEAMALTEGAGEVNTGQDITKPVRRFDLRFSYTNAADFSFPQPLGRGEAADIVRDTVREGVRRGDSAKEIQRTAERRLREASLKEFEPDVHTITLRMDLPRKLGGGWAFNTRFDLPMSFNDIPTRDNPTGDTEFNVNDVLVQGLLIKAFNPAVAVGFGTQFIIPTGTDDSFSGNRWRLVPTVGARVSLPQITKGSFFAFGARYDWDFAGDDGRSHTSQLQFSPTLNIALPDRWFLTLFPSTDIRVDLEDGGKWFVPANFMIGKMLNKSTVASVEVGIPIIDDFDLYDFKVEARVGFFF